jgi:hypothetical protein
MAAKVVSYSDRRKPIFWVIMQHGWFRTDSSGLPIGPILILDTTLGLPETSVVNQPTLVITQKIEEFRRK